LWTLAESYPDLTGLASQQPQNFQGNARFRYAPVVGAGRKWDD